MLTFIFQLINIAGSVLERPVIRKQFTNRYARILELLNMELSVVEVLFNRGTRDTLIDLPPLAAALTFTSMLRQRIDLPIQSFKAMSYPYVLKCIKFFLQIPFSFYSILDIVLLTILYKENYLKFIEDKNKICIFLIIS